MTANHNRDVLDMIEDLKRQVNDLRGALALGSQPALCTSSTHPANPTLGQPIHETDTGLDANWTGTAWEYPPQLIYEAVLTGSSSTVRLPASGSLPQGFSHLRLAFSARSSGSTSSGYDAAGLQMNGVTSASYNWNSWTAAQAASSMAVANGSGVANAQCARIWNSFFAGTGGRGAGTIEIPNYSDPNAVKVFTCAGDATDGGAAGILFNYAGSLSGTTAVVSSLTLLMGIGSFLADSTFSLYGY